MHPRPRASTVLWLVVMAHLATATVGCGPSSAPLDAGTRPPGTDAPALPDTDGGPVDPGSLRRFGPVHEGGQYHLGPVEWTGSFWNACAPYDPAVESLEGGFLAGLSNEVAADGSFCDACVEVTTDRGRTLVARVVTYGVSGAPNDMDVSQAAFDALTEGEFPRAMHWQLVTCPGVDPVYVQLQTGANEWWTSLWIRNPRIAVASVEVRSANHPSFTAMTRGADGTFTDASGFGAGAFTLRIIAIDGGTLEESFPGFAPGELLRGTANFP